MTADEIEQLRQDDPPDAPRLAACLAQAWDTDKVNPIAQFNPNYAVSDPVADTIFTASQPKR